MCSKESSEIFGVNLWTEAIKDARRQLESERNLKRRIQLQVAITLFDGRLKEINADKFPVNVGAA